MATTKLWHVPYGTVLVVFIAIAVIVGVIGADEVYEGALKTVLSYSILVHLGIIALFSLLERILTPAGPRKPWKGYLLNLQVVLFRNITAPIFAAMFGACAAMLGQHFNLGWIDLRFTAGHGVGSLILAALLNVLIFDFFYYWWHRFQHESRILWQEHKLHHMDEELCALVRESPVEPFFQGAAVTLPMVVLFKLDPMQGMIGAYFGYVILAWANVFVHTNIRLPLGRATALLAGPQVHRIHHSTLPQHFDKNYAAMLPIWDVLFGTYYHPKRDEYPPTGVHDEKEVESFAAALTLPFRSWHAMFRDWRCAQGTLERSTEAVKVEVERGKSYFWCACGRSQKQPFCDGSHRGTGILPVAYKATETTVKWFCVCKRTRNPPFCDGTHNSCVKSTLKAAS